MSKKTTVPDVLVRAHEVDDWEDIAAIRNNPSVVYNTLQPLYLSRDVTREKLENRSADQPYLVAVVDDKVVGQLGLKVGTGRQAHVASLGMMVHADYQGRGVGTALMEAAIEFAENWLNISRIDLEVYTDNEPALALYRKFGFEIEGTLRQYAFRAGQYVDAYLMSRIREGGE